MLQDPVDEARNIIKTAGERKITLRLIGGIAFRIRCPSTARETLSRHYADIDFVGMRKQRKSVDELFVGCGYAPRTTFNALSGGIRLIYNDFEHQRRADVFLDIFEMSHKLDFSARLGIDDVTLPLADLLLTKLQVHEFTEKEHKDVIALLLDAAQGESDGLNIVNMKYVAEQCARDWGLYRTVTLNLDKVKSSASSYLPEPGEQQTLNSSITRARERIEAEPKTMGWKMRARLGDRKQWYEVPESDQEVVDSRSISERKAPSSTN